MDPLDMVGRIRCEMGRTLTRGQGGAITIPVCCICGDDKGEVMMLGELPQGAKVSKYTVLDLEPCDECKADMRRGIVLVEIEKGDPAKMRDIHRTGNVAVVEESEVENLTDDASIVSRVRETRFAFVPEDAWERLGLPHHSGEM